MVLQFVGEYVAAFLLKTPFLTKRGFLFYKYFLHANKFTSDSFLGAISRFPLQSYVPEPRAHKDFRFNRG
jgi:hypothetical protein